MLNALFSKSGAKVTKKLLPFMLLKKKLRIMLSIFNFLSSLPITQNCPAIEENR